MQSPASDITLSPKAKQTGNLQHFELKNVKFATENSELQKF
ncbi:hypothetical protein Riv7116_5948 [Rivularia sp. PCC 7116]|nr:hypothetical protein Riv7116_5948 [Rivularia sp. PCC 7116]